MNKNILIVTIALLAVAAGVFVWTSDNDARGPVLSSVGGKLNGNPTDFSREGVIVFERIGGELSSPYFTYAGDGAGSSTELVFDPMSYCGGSSGFVPCQAMSVALDVPFGGRNAVVEGIVQADEEGQSQVLVRKLYRLEEGEQARVPEAGSVFISWPQAVSLIESCAPKMIMQTHALDVYLTMNDNARLRAVEPVIDEVFKVVNENRGGCDPIPLATE